MTSICWALATGVILFVIPPGALAAPGDIDPAFSRDGFSPVRDRLQTTLTRDMDLDSRGRIVVVAERSTLHSFNDGFVLARLRPNGEIDKAFGPKGIVTRRLSGAIEAVATDSKDRIVVGGNIDGDPLIARFRADGRADKTFGDRGSARIPLDEEYGSISDLAVIANDAIAASGRIANELLVARLTASGAPETGFAGDGIVRAPFMADLAMNGEALVVAPGGDLIVSGVAGREGEDVGQGLLRLSASGSRVQDFGENGTALIEHTFGSASFLSDVALDAKGRVLVAANECTLGRFGGCRAAVARVTGAGKLDRSFAEGGSWSETPAHIADVVVHTGRIVLAATVGPSTGGSERINMGIFRLTARGNRDASFSEDGKAGIDFGFGYEDAEEVAIDRRGRIVVAGDLFDSLGSSNADILVARHQSARGKRRDADGDRLHDRRDSCRFIFGPGRSGCPRVRRFVHIRTYRDRIRVRVDSAAEACTRAARIRLMRASAGPDERIAQGKTSEYGNWGAGDVKPSARLYVRVAPSRVPGLARCRGARSERLRAADG